MATKRLTFEIDTTGGAGVSAGSNRVGVPNGRLIAVGIAYHASAPATCDFVLTCEDGVTTRTLLTLTDRNTNLPLQELMNRPMDEVGADLADSLDSPNYVHPVVAGNIVGTIAQSDDLTPTVTVEVWVEY